MSEIFGVIGHLFNILFTQPIFNGLMLLYYVFNDFGLSIVVLTLIIKLLLFPLTLKQLKSMKATQQLQQPMKEIREKYAKDPQAQAQAMQALYREYKINPLAGCLPMVVQLPVLYGLYYALYNTLQHPAQYKDTLYSFFHPLFETVPDVNFNWFHWLSFLNGPLGVDWSWTFSLAHPDPSHVLPILAAAATFIQIRMSMAQSLKSRSTKPAAGQPDPTAQTMKMMQYLMPGMTLVFGWSFPAGLALYWTISSIFQSVQQYFVTGWGSLWGSKNSDDPKGGNGSSSSTSTKAKDETKTDEADSNSPDKTGSIASKMHTTQRPGNGSSAHRSRNNNSASARRRSSNARSRR